MEIKNINSRHSIIPKGMNPGYEIYNKISSSKISFQKKEIVNKRKREKNRKYIEHDLNLTNKPINITMKLNSFVIKNNNILYNKAIEKNIKNNNDILKTSKNKYRRRELLTLENDDISKIKLNRYLNHFRKITTEIGNSNKYKIDREKGNKKENFIVDNNIILNKNIYPYNKKCLIKGKGIHKIITANNFKKKEKFINNYKTFKISTHIRSSKSELTRLDKIKFYKGINNSLTETNKNKNNLDYLKNKNNKLKLINDAKISLINGNDISDNKKNFLLKNQVNKDYENLKKKELNENIKNNKELEHDKFNWIGNKKRIKLFKSNKSNLKEVFQPNKKIFHKKVNSVKYYHNHSELKSRLQKYFSLTPNDLFIPNKSKLEIEDYNKINYKINNNSITFSKNNRSNKVLIRKIKIIKVEKSKNIFKFKKKFNNTNNNPIKSLNIQETDNSIDKLNYKTQNNRKLANENKKNYLGMNDNESIRLNTIDLNNKSKFQISHIPKSKSLNILNELDDYIGPNQYECIEIPNDEKKITKMIAEKKENEINKKRIRFKTEETKRNNEFISKIINRHLKCSEDYYNDNYFKKLVLSGEKTSKFFLMKNSLYESAFKKFKN